MLFIGDCHGSFKTYSYILFKMQHKGEVKGVPCSFQCGDFGMGFRDRDPDYSKDGKGWLSPIDRNHKFIRGNHDDPSLCYGHPNFAGDYGYFEKPDIFYVSGGFSVDYFIRQARDAITGDKTWWENEELLQEQLDDAIEYYTLAKPKIMVTHECPTVAKYDVVTNSLKKEVISRTEKTLQMMFEIHKPEIWIFGHHHIRKNMWISGTKFVALGELYQGKIDDCIYKISDLTWE